MNSDTQYYLDKMLCRLKTLKYIPSYYDTIIGHQVFTPYSIAKEMEDMQGIDLWSNKDAKIIDIACKSGVYIAEAYLKFMVGLEDVIPNAKTRHMHILMNQLYAICLSDVCWTLAHKLLYNNMSLNGNITLVSNYLDSMRDKNLNIKQIIAKEFGENMKFDMIIGNPPYNDGDGGGGAGNTESSSPIYAKFIEKAIDLKPRYISMIIPSRWMQGGKEVLDKFRTYMIKDRHLSTVVNYNRSRDIFENVDIIGGVQYFLWDKDYSGNALVINRANGQEDNTMTRDLSQYTYKNAYDKEQYMVIIDNRTLQIVEKVTKITDKTISDTMLKYNPFDLKANFTDSEVPTANKSVAVVCSYGRITYTDPKMVTNNDLIDKWKVVVAKASNLDGRFNGDAYSVISAPKILPPNHICTITYHVLGVFDNEAEAKNFESFIRTKTCRFLILATLSGLNISKRNYMFVPSLDWKTEWTDTLVYSHYGFTDDEINYIEGSIKLLK